MLPYEHLDNPSPTLKPNGNTVNVRPRVESERNIATNSKENIRDVQNDAIGRNPTPITSTPVDLVSSKRPSSDSSSPNWVNDAFHTLGRTLPPINNHEKSTSVWRRPIQRPKDRIREHNTEELPAGANGRILAVELNHEYTPKPKYVPIPLYCATLPNSNYCAYSKSKK
ncbi:hypothetical protein ROZALSC1DRAFT_25566 [Rozella allomycis CSF55]|uniref:Uncharacterized protein n=1 Tax=Rozella allomycis (strain CSF55) TaxID=988480 RepID=A0A4P9YAX5_ROZAC|nr:hypothetical protein ROZALSC1DRAFT_25566 [Rozella allomycis CSF55]